MKPIRGGARDGTTSVVTVEPAIVALLVRHAHTDAIGHRLVGRLDGVSLSPYGRVQAERLGRALAHPSLDAIYSSPLERAVETARAIAKHHGCRVVIHADLNEIDFGDWTGLTFDELGRRDDWRTFNERRSIAEVPRGESAAAAQRRILTAIANLAADHTGQRIAIVSHADVLRAAVLHYSAVPLDRFHEIEIAPASVTALSISRDPGAAEILYVNDCGALD